MMGFLVGNGANVYALRQDGGTLTGSVEGMGGGFFGGNDAPVPIQEGKVDGQNVSFKIGDSTFSGSLKDGQLELVRKIDLSRWLSRTPKEPAGPRPAIRTRRSIFPRACRRGFRWFCAGFSAEKPGPL